MRNRSYYVYIMASRNNNVLYIGITNDLEKRVFQHKAGGHISFTQKYNCNKLVWFDETSSIYEAITYEKKLKAGSRRKKELLIRALNPEWIDLVSKFA